MFRVVFLQSLLLLANIFERIIILSSPPYTLQTAFRILNMTDDCDYSKTLACSDRQFLPCHNPSFTKFIKYS